jgi:hypothetical protein
MILIPISRQNKELKLNPTPYFYSTNIQYNNYQLDLIVISTTL